MSITDPAYYVKAPIQPIDIFEDYVKDISMHHEENTGLKGKLAPYEIAYLFNVLKYFMRYAKKNTLYVERTDDIKKAVWYLDRIETNLDLNPKENLGLNEPLDFGGLTIAEHDKVVRYSYAVISSNHFSIEETIGVPMFFEYWLSYIKQNTKLQRINLLKRFQNDLNNLVTYLDSLDETTYNLIRHTETESEDTGRMNPIEGTNEK